MSEICAELHSTMQRCRRLTTRFEPTSIPRNGLYVLFEEVEKGHGGDRIVRIGTHTGPNQLPSRLAQHFVNENKDRSIFRKNIGRALLNRAHDPFLEEWEWDLTSHAGKAKYQARLDSIKRGQTEREVTQYMQKAFSFVVCRLDDPTRRLALESKLISTVSQCNQCGPSDKWLGNHSPKDKIRESGLWQVNELGNRPLTQAELDELITLMSAA